MILYVESLRPGIKWAKDILMVPCLETGKKMCGTMRRGLSNPSDIGYPTFH